MWLAATGDVLAAVPLSPPEEVDQAAHAAATAAAEWRRTPATERIQYLFTLKALLEDHLDPILEWEAAHIEAAMRAFCEALTSTTASTIREEVPNSWAMRIIAWVSFGKHEPP